MEFKHTKCRSCGTKQSPIKARQPMRDTSDYFCQKCIDGKKHLE